MLPSVEPSILRASVPPQQQEVLVSILRPAERRLVARHEEGWHSAKGVLRRLEDAPRRGSGPHTERPDLDELQRIFLQQIARTHR